MSDSGPGRREVAYRLFAAEFDDAEFSYSESDEERAPNYVVTPTGARANRVFAVGVLTEVEDVNPEMVRGRVVDPTGAFVTYAGQYQPEALAFLERADPPTFIALSGKARTFEPDDGDQIYTSVRPESVSEVDAETRDRAAVVATERTLERIGVMASAIESELEGDRLRAALEEAGVDERLADGVALALDHYGTTPAYLEALRELSLDVARVVAGEREEVGSFDVAPGEGMGDAAPLATLDLSAVSIPEPATASDAGSTAGSEPTATTDESDLGESAREDSDGDEPTASTATESPTTSDPDVETDTDADTGAGSTAATGAEPDEATATTSSEPDTGAVSGTDPSPADATERDAEEVAEPGETADSGSSDEPADEPTGEPLADDLGSDAPAEEPGDFDPGEYELDEAERREVEEEHGTEFSTADEIEDADVGSPEPEVESDPEPEAEADVGNVPESDPDVEPEVESDPEPEAETDRGQETEPEPEPASEPEVEAAAGDGAEETGESAGDGAEETGEPAEETSESEQPEGDVDLEDAVVATMESLDDGDGADHDEVVASVVDEYGADPAAVEDAVQDALMSGRCYEPSDGTLKSI